MELIETFLQKAEEYIKREIAYRSWGLDLDGDISITIEMRSRGTCTEDAVVTITDSTGETLKQHLKPVSYEEFHTIAQQLRCSHATMPALWDGSEPEISEFGILFTGEQATERYFLTD